jgi:hypothetical protein
MGAFSQTAFETNFEDQYGHILPLINNCQIYAHTMLTFEIAKKSAYIFISAKYNYRLMAYETIGSYVTCPVPLYQG